MQVLASLNGLIQALPRAGRSTLDTILETLRTLFGGDVETRRRVAFSVAIIALSAKMAKADGVVSIREVAAFRQILEIPQEEIRNVFRLYDLAKQDTAGFETYAARMTTLCRDADGDCQLLADVLDGLFHIAKADGTIHERELHFLEAVAQIFGLDEADFRQVKNRHILGPENPYAVLGLDPGTTKGEARQRYLTLVRENHPDRLAARGVPDEFMFIANERMKAINQAYGQISGKTAA